MRTQYALILLLSVFITETLVYSQSIQTCPFGNYLTPDNKCAECLTSCSTCKDLVSPCERCSEGQNYRRVDKSCRSCQRGQLTCGLNITCQPHYQLLNGMCQPVCAVIGCVSCSSIFTQQCTKCAQNYTLSKDGKFCINKGGRKLQQELPVLRDPTEIIKSGVQGLVNSSSLTLESNVPNTNIQFSSNIANNLDSFTKEISAGKENPIEPKVSDASTDAVSALSGFSSIPEFKDSEFPQVDFSSSGFQPINTISNQTTDDFSQTSPTTPVAANPIGQNKTETVANQTKKQPTESNQKDKDIIDSHNETKSQEKSNLENTIKNQTINDKTTSSLLANSTGFQDEKIKNNSVNTPNSTKAVTNQPITILACPIGKFLKDQLCLNCEVKCATCINSPEQCLQCAEGWKKIGWKCIKNETLSFNFNLMIPTVVSQSPSSTPANKTATNASNTNGTNVSNYILQLKDFVLNKILPKEYADTAGSMTLQSLKVEGRKLILTGFFDRLNTTIPELLKSVNEKLKKTSNLGPLVLNNYVLSSTSHGSTGSSSTKQTSSHAAAIVGGIIGGLVLVCLISCALCYCCKVCCFKKVQKNQKTRVSEPEAVDSDRRFGKYQESKEKNVQWGQAPSNEVLGDGKVEIVSDENDAVKAVVSKPTTRQTYLSNYAGDDVVEYASDKDEYPNNRY